MQAYQIIERHPQHQWLIREPIACQFSLTQVQLQKINDESNQLSKLVKHLIFQLIIQHDVNNINLLINYYNH